MPDAPANQPTVRAIARALNRIEMKMVNADATPEDIKASWHARRGEYTNKSRRLLLALEKQGFTVVAPETIS